MRTLPLQYISLCLNLLQREVQGVHMQQQSHNALSSNPVRAQLLMRLNPLHIGHIGRQRSWVCEETGRGRAACLVTLH